MSTQYLGETFDIHGGGLDLRFPHHENELAQSTAAGFEFARIWVHNGLVAVGDQKMSKSLGNSVFAADLLDAAPAQAVRYFLSSAHYRSTLEYSPSALDEAAAAVGRINGFVQRLHETVEGVDDGADAWAALPTAFVEAMDDDLGVPQGLAVLHEQVRRGNAALADGDAATALQAGAAVEAMLRVLGLHPDDFAAETDGDDAAERVLDQLVAERLKARATARNERDFSAADRIRDELIAAGLQIEDTPNGAKWSVE